MITKNYYQYTGAEQTAKRILIGTLLACCVQTAIFAAPIPAEPALAEDHPSKRIHGSVKQWTLNHQNADIREFIGQIAKITGETFVIDPKIKGGNTVSVISSTPLSKDEVYDVFLEVLAANSYTAIPKDGLTTIVPNTSAKTSASNSQIRPENAVMTTRVVELHSVSAIELIPIIRPLIAQFGHAAASASSNAVIISDLADNVDRVSKVIRELDETGNNDYEVIQLNHAWVGDVAKIIQDTLASSKTPLPSGVNVIADERNNRLVVKANSSKRIRIKKLVETLDKEGVRKSNTMVNFLSYTDAKSMAEILSEASTKLQESGPKKNSQNSSPFSPSHPAGGPKPLSDHSDKNLNPASTVFVKADESQNALVLIADPDTLSEMDHIIKQLDVPRSQVLLEAAIVEVSGGVDDALGIQWGIDGTHTVRSGDTAPSSITGKILDNSKLTLGSVALRADNFGVLISALSSKSNNDILSTPSLMTLDNQQAEFLVGKNIPIRTGSYQTGAGGAGSNPFTTTDRKDVGIKLKITPHLSESESIRLELEQEVSSLDLTSSNDLLNGQDLVFNNRTLKTTVLVDDSQTIVIGGLIENVKIESKRKIPILGSIPLIGHLFTFTQKKNDKRNLMLFIRPTIMRNSETLAKASQDRFNKLKLLQKKGKQPVLFPEDLDTLFETEAFDLRKKDKKIWQSE